MSGIMVGRVTLGRVMVEPNGIGFRVQNGRLNRVSESKRAVESGGPAGPGHNRAGHFGFRSYQIWVSVAYNGVGRVQLEPNG